MSTTVCSSLDQVPVGFFAADCAVSGGSLRAGITALLQAAEGRLCLRIAPVYMDFPLPCPDGTGRPISSEELTLLRGDLPCHYAEALCAEYFTLLREDGAHAVLFDSRRSLMDKYRLSRELGVPYVLIESPGILELIKSAPRDRGAP